ncbi:MAG TPA: hypothetical protein VFL63_04130 [Rhodanobacteraceae bacterium]|nr:hypothetical protein [Rhodanobacteraceae bacterium]
MCLPYISIFVIYVNREDCEPFGITVSLGASMVSALGMLLWMAAHSNKYFDKSNERYYKVTMGGGNPLNAVFFVIFFQKMAYDGVH